jgi:hypothetical protein
MSSIFVNSTFPKSSFDSFEIFASHFFFSFYDMGSCHLSMPLYNFCSWSLVWSLQAVKTGDTIFIGQYLFTGSETTSVWLEVSNFIEACHVTYFSRQACLSQIIIISLM